MKNQEGQTSLDLATADDVRALLQDAMPEASASTSKTVTSPTAANQTYVMYTNCLVLRHHDNVTVDLILSLFFVCYIHV